LARRDQESGRSAEQRAEWSGDDGTRFASPPRDPDPGRPFAEDERPTANIPSNTSAERGPGTPGATDLNQNTLIPIMPPTSTAAEHWIEELGLLLQQLEHSVGAGSAPSPVFNPGTDNQLVQVRLGVASSLFAALQCKHPPTASHSLRVALTCSAWAVHQGLDRAERDHIEIAGLLHDVGMIGTPDSILLKPLPLSEDEAAVVARSRQMSLEILRRSCSVPEVLEIVGHVTAWYDGSVDAFERAGDELPRGARMIAIAEAFDAMTTDHVYRPAMSQERAMNELFECSGSQFDPALVQDFAEFHRSDQRSMQAVVASRWLQALDPEMVNSSWELNGDAPSHSASPADSLFQAKLLENMYDAVMFVDDQSRITLWNRGAERLTGITGNSVRERRWHPDLLEMGDEKGQPVGENDCPVTSAIRSGVQSLRRLTICGRNGRPVAVDSHAIPVISEDGGTLGAILLFHDASSEISLEERCQSLHEKATRDPLTQVANRAEFDRVHEMFVAAHQEHQMPCALMMMDLDRFKLVNDTYGHQAGDAALLSLAKLLKGSCRPGDLVARYGGEEFVMLCADCDNATAARRAEHLRQSLAQSPQPALDGRSVTASFGVTEIQPGDTPETMLRRADRALMRAKTQGRNQVVQLGSGSVAESEGEKKPARKTKAADQSVLERSLVTAVPIKIAVEKLRGFIADHEARVVKTDGDSVTLNISEDSGSRQRRFTDRPISFQVSIKFKERRDRTEGQQPRMGPARTTIHVRIAPLRGRDRRRENLAQRARDVLISFQSYLMAQEIPTEQQPEQPETRLSRAARFLTPWRKK